MAQVDGVHIVDQDVVLAHLLFELDGEVLFLNFTLHALGKRLTGPAGEDVVLDELLGDGGSALGKISGRDAFDGSTENTLNINAVVIVEAVILDGDKGVLQVLGNLVDGHRNAVGIGGDKFGGLIAVTVVHERGVPGGGHVDVADIRRRIDNRAEGSDSDTKREDDDGQNDDQKNLKRRESSLSFPLLCFACEAALFCRYAVSAVICIHSLRCNQSFLGRRGEKSGSAA